MSTPDMTSTGDPSRPPQEPDASREEMLSSREAAMSARENAGHAREDAVALREAADRAREEAAACREDVRFSDALGRAMARRGFGNATHMYSMLGECGPLFAEGKRRGLIVISEIILRNTEMTKKNNLN